MKRISGRITVSTASIAYYPQTPFILNASIRENIVFGNSWNETKYHSILKSCELLKDIEKQVDKNQIKTEEKPIQDHKPSTKPKFVKEHLITLLHQYFSVMGLLSWSILLISAVIVQTLSHLSQWWFFNNISSDQLHAVIVFGLF